MQLFSTMVGALNGTASKLFTNYVAAVVILLVGFIAARLVGILSKTILHRVGLNKLIKKSMGLRLSFEEILTTFFVYFLYFITIVMTLNQIGLITQLSQIISIAIIVIVIISVIIALKDFLPNLIAGFHLLHYWHLKVGSTLEFDNTQGKIVEINLLDTKLETPEKDYLIVPNTTLYKKTVKLKH